MIFGIIAFTMVLLLYLAFFAIALFAYLKVRPYIKAFKPPTIENEEETDGGN